MQIIAKGIIYMSTVLLDPQQNQRKDVVLILPYDKSVTFYKLSSVSICINLDESQIIQLHVFFFSARISIP